MDDINCWETKFKPCCYSERLLTKISLINEITEHKVDLLEIKKAIYYTKKHHGTQMRQSGEPYYSHPLEVAFNVADHCFKTDILVTSVLHDTLEDTELTKDMIKYIFDADIANQVEDLTRIKSNRKISSAEMLELLCAEKKEDLLLIKLFDRVHNMQTISAKIPEKIKKIADETFNSFIAYAMHLQNKNLENTIYQLCCKTLSIKMITFEFLKTITNASHLFCIEDNDTHQLLSQVFQNITVQIKN